MTLSPGERHRIEHARTHSRRPTAHEVRTAIREYPLTTVLVTGAAGVLVGVVLAKMFGRTTTTVVTPSTATGPAPVSIPTPVLTSPA
jgi:hypothetical protein